ncbi:MAG: helix-turn-helix transcriptional regulator [Devosia sp.]|nr:helix-turn-helix transcriptional regulator [Devosia sp.]
MNVQPASPAKPRVQLKGMEPHHSSIAREWYGDTGCVQGYDDFEASPFVNAVVKWVRQFVFCVDGADFRIKEHFQQAMWTLGQLGVSEQELAEILSTTPNAVNRWMNGRSSPTPVVRWLVIKAGLDILRRDGLRIAGQNFDPINGRPLSTIR